MKRISRDEFRALLQRAVDEKGSKYVYPSSEKGPEGECRYFTQDGKPSCIVGHVLHYLGTTPEDVLEGQTATQALDRLGYLPGEGWRTFVAVDQVQDLQDGGHSWDVALFSFDRTEY